MQYSEKFAACRDVVIRAQILKNNNDHLFGLLLDKDNKLSSTDEILYHLPSYRMPGKIIEQITYSIVKELYDKQICQKYGFEKPYKLQNKDQHSDDLFDSIKEIAILEIEYFGKLNECYEQELALLNTKTI